MCDVASLSIAELDARLSDGIARRLDADTPDERARAGADLIAVVRELRRRGRGPAAHEGHGHLRVIR